MPAAIGLPCALLVAVDCTDDAAPVTLEVAEETVSPTELTPPLVRCPAEDAVPMTFSLIVLTALLADSTRRVAMADGLTFS
jgi:hypothetical protein